MNKDQLLDAIGMVDEQKIRDAVMVKRTKRVSAVLTVLVILVAVAVLLVIGYGVSLFVETVVDYTPLHIAQDIRGATVVTVCPDPANRHADYTIYVPQGTAEAMRFHEWEPVEAAQADGRAVQLRLRFHDLNMVFYEDGLVCAQKRDWDEYIGVYAVPDGLWQEVLAFLPQGQ